MSTDTDLEPLIEFLLGTKVAPVDMPWRRLRREDLQVARAWASETQGPATQRRLGNALRRTIRAAPRDDEAELSSDVRWRSRSSATLPATPISSREARLLQESVAEPLTLTDARDSAIIALLLLAGMRPAELVRLQRGDYDEEEGLLRVRTAGRALRVLLLQGPCQHYLDAWLEARGGVSGPLLLTIARDETVHASGLSAPTINDIVTRRARAAGLNGVTPRSMRARFLAQLRAGLRNGSTPPCRYYLTEDGQPAWTLPSLPGM